MITLNCPQGSLAWLAARRGLPTASQFHRLITAKKMQPSEQATGYRNLLLAEWLLGENLDDDLFQFMQRGEGLEEGAFDFYEMQQEVDVDRIGFVLRSDRRSGCSPDGLIGTDGGLELKCPSPQVHLGYLLDGMGDAYRAQVQGCLYICEREWWDWLSYHPTLPPVLVRCYRDEPFIKTLASILDAFCDHLDAMKEDLKRRGFTPAVPVSPVATEVGA
jgi:hypothetical protein